MSGADLKHRFSQCKEENRAALVVYLTQGDPTPEATPQLMAALADGGADVIELGVPFSDPSADGPVIQRAMQRAILAGGGLSSALQSIREFRSLGYDTPIVLFGYYNPIYVRGTEAFAKEAAEAGVDALLTVDVPIDELSELSEPLAKEGIGVVPLLAPTSTPERIRRVKDFDPAFVYYVSMTGVTGSAFQGTSGGAERMSEIQQATDAFVAVGFGIKTHEDAKSIAAHADGVVVGSALVQRIEDASSVQQACASLKELTLQLRSAMPR